MKARLVLLALLLALCGHNAFAHGNKVHVRGTVEKINSDVLQVKTPEGKMMEVKVTASTVFLLRAASVDKPAKLADLAVGDLVVIHAAPKGDNLEAEEIKFSVPASNKISSSAVQKPKT